MAFEFWGLRRKELYETVWTVSPEKLCARFEVSLETLFAICVDLAIPWPPMGYWRRQRAGTTPIKLRLMPPSQLQRSTQFRPGHAAQLLSDTIRRKGPPLPLPVSKKELRHIDIINQIFRAAMGKNIAGRVVGAGVLEFSGSVASIRCSLKEVVPRGVRTKAVGRPKPAVPSTTLVFKFDESCPECGTQTEWLEQRGARLERALPTIVEAIAVVSKEQDRRVAVALSETQARTAIMIKRRRDDQHWNALVKAVDRRTTENRVKSVLNEMEARTKDPEMIVGDRSIEDWFDWARAELCRLAANVEDDVAGFWQEIASSNDSPFGA